MEENKTIVKLKTNCYVKNGKACIEKEIILLKKKSKEPFKFDYIVDNSEEIKHITNLYKVKDGIYELDLCNFSTDYETGYCDDWEYILKEIKDN